MLSLVPSLVIQNFLTLTRQFNVLSGGPPWISSFVLWKTLIHGPWCPYLQTRKQLVVSEFIKSNVILMEVFRGIKYALWEKALLRSKGLIIMIPLLPLPNLSLFMFCWLYQQLKIGLCTNWMSKMHFYIVISMRKYVCACHRAIQERGSVTLFANYRGLFMA